MKSVELGKATGALADYAAEIEEGPVVVTKRGRPVAALIPIREADLESLLLSVNPRFQAIIKRSRAEYKRKGGLSEEELRKRLESPTGSQAGSRPEGAQVGSLGRKPQERRSKNGKPPRRGGGPSSRR